jgi:uncharacterized protein (UPF0335 family)
MSPEFLPVSPCPICKSLIAVGGKYCSQCGSPADSQSPLLDAFSRDRRAIENDITERVAERIIKWAKWIVGVFIVFAGLVAAVVGFLGFNLRTSLQQEVKQVRGIALNARKEITQDSQELKRQYQQIDMDINHYKDVNASINRLQKDLSTIHGQIDSWYKNLETETFDSVASGRVKFRKLTSEERERLKAYERDADDGFIADVGLRKPPIPASVRVSRFSLYIIPPDVTVKGSHIYFVTPSEKLDRPEGSPITVQYHIDSRSPGN